MLYFIWTVTLIVRILGLLIASEGEAAETFCVISGMQSVDARSYVIFKSVVLTMCENTEEEKDKWCQVFQKIETSIV